MRETLGRMLGDDARPIDVGMLVIELLVLALIAVEVVWNGKDRFLNWRERKHDERRMLQQLALLSATESAALRALLLTGNSSTSLLFDLSVHKCFDSILRSRV